MKLIVVDAQVRLVMDGQTIDWPELSRALRNPRFKLALMTVFLQFVMELPQGRLEPDEGWVRLTEYIAQGESLGPTVDVAKQRALYVSLDAERLMTPDQFVTPSLTGALVRGSVTSRH